MSEGGPGSELGPLSCHPRAYRERARLLDGREVVLRAIRPEDKEALLEGFHRLSDRSVYFRFFRPKKELSPAELAYLTEVDFEKHVALVAAIEEDGEERGIGVGRYIVGPEPSRAEMAFAVDEEHRGLGVATLLLSHLARIARASGLRELYGFVLYENRAMLEVFEHAGFPMKRRLEGHGLEVILEVGPGRGA